MKLVVGLGNSGPKYNGTRHNTGFIMLNKLAKVWDTEFKEKPEFHSKLAETTIGNEKVVLMKPGTFYNRSGEAVRAVRDFYKLANQDILVIHDDMALPFGKLRIRFGGSDAGNNGIKSLNQSLGSDYPRLRIGIWKRALLPGQSVEFVLGKLATSEQKAIRTAAEQVIGPALKQFVTTGELPPHTIDISVGSP